ncbi:MAG: DUF4038 domain-containing protein [Eubacteriaceae bacterium]|jgi:hypothetical protein
MLSINNNRTLTQNGTPFFWLADTVWSAFTSMTDDEFDFYLRTRAQQGFNVLQINILPQWDRCWVPAQYLPFRTESDSKFDFSTGFQNDYFNHAREICQKATEAGFTVALVVLWSNYVPGTWASGINSDNIMPESMLKDYCRKVTESFDEFEPVYIISGDTDFDTADAVRYYSIILDEMNRLSPDSLKTMHIKGRYTYLPETIADKLDFYLYQSGHNSAFPEKPYTMPMEFREKYPLKPLINSEPCYEQMGYSGHKYGRFDCFDVRRAAWMSLLSGADAGITYGAHGIWNWQKTGMPVNPNTGEGFDEAMPWQDAIQFPGAWDYGYLKYFLESRNITTLIPTKIVLNETDEIRSAETPDGKINLIYVPSNTKVRLDKEFTDKKIKTIDLTTKRIASPVVFCKEGTTTIGLCPFKKDILIVIED